MRKKPNSKQQTPKKANTSISKRIAEIDNNSRRRNSILFERVTKNDLIASSDEERTKIENHYGGDKYGSSISNHTAKNWGFGTGFNNTTDESVKKNKKSK